jgi:hypothetical protein
MGIIHSGTYSIGEEIAITNPNSGAARYRADFGTAGAVIVTIPPGGEFTVVVGTHGPQIYLEDYSTPDLHAV